MHFKFPIACLFVQLAPHAAALHTEAYNCSGSVEALVGTVLCIGHAASASVCLYAGAGSSL